MCPYILLFMVFQITPLQVYRTNVTFPRSMVAKEKEPKKIRTKPKKENKTNPKKIKTKKNVIILTSMQSSRYLR